MPNLYKNSCYIRQAGAGELIADYFADPVEEQLLYAMAMETFKNANEFGFVIDNDVFLLTYA